jgi:hypothetical protein
MITPEAAMSTKPESHETGAPKVRRTWEAPTLSALPLQGGTRDPANAPVPCPEPPIPAEAKPGLSIEWSFPLAYREK